MQAYSTEQTLVEPPQPLLAFIKREKYKYIETLKKSLLNNVDHPINRYLGDSGTPLIVGAATDFYSAVFTERTLSILPEINYKCKTGFIVNLPPPEIMGGVLRECGAKGVVVSLHEKTGGVSASDFQRFTAEQTKARIFLPGPIPIIWNDVVVDKIQVIHAASLGASAITLHPYYSQAPGEGLQDFVQSCKQHNVEPIVMVGNVQEGLHAIEAGSRCICLHSLDEAGLLALRDQLPEKHPATGTPVLYIARLRAEADFSIYAEIDTSWVLRDHGGFAAVWPSPEAVYATGMGDIYPTITAMRSKASREFLSPRQFMMDRKNEGATEYLGDILY